MNRLLACVHCRVPYRSYLTRLHSFGGLSQLLEENIRKVKLSTPDYRDMDPEEAVVDFKQRREIYMRVYETVAEADGSYIKIINSKQCTICFHVDD